MPPACVPVNLGACSALIRAKPLKNPSYCPTRQLPCGQHRSQPLRQSNNQATTLAARNYHPAYGENDQKAGGHCLSIGGRRPRYSFVTTRVGHCARSGCREAIAGARPKRYPVRSSSAATDIT